MRFQAPRCLRSWLLGFAAFLALAGTLGQAHATEQLVDAAPMDGKKIRFDGLLREWPQPIKLSERISGSGSDPSAEAVAAYDKTNIYVAMRVKDSKLVRTSGFSKNEDHASLLIAFPNSAGGHKSYEVRLYPGEPGKSAGSVKIEGVGTVSGSQIIEAPDSGGFSFEAKIPWSAFPEAKSVRSGLRGALRYTDVDAGGKTSVIATSKSSGSSLPLFTIEAEYALNQALIFPKGLKTRPDKSLVANVVGDAMLEHVAVYDRYLAVTGWNYREGKEFFYQDLNLQGPGSLRRFDLKDIDGDGHDDIVLRRRVGSSGDAKDYFEVWHFRASNDAPQLLFQVEVGMIKGAAHIDNKVDLTRKGGKWSITVEQGSEEDLDPEEWDGPTISGDRATLMPWETIKSRRYEWSGENFKMVEEKEWKPKMKSPKGSRMSVVSGDGASGDPISSNGGDAPKQAEPPRPPTAEEMMDQVYALYRADRGVKKSKPRFDFATDVAGSEHNERVLVHDKDIVAFGKKFKGGTSYVYTSIGVKDQKDILDVTARDVTGDGRADIIVRAIIPVKASAQLGGDVVTRHALMIYQVSEEGVQRIFGAETGRSLEDNAILGRIAFVPVGDAMKIELQPGRAVGWTQSTYPFPEDKLPYGGLEPLLLPWTEMSSRSYVFGSGGFKQVE